MARYSLFCLSMLYILTGCGGGDTRPVAPSGLSYESPPTLTVGTAMQRINPTVTGSVDSYSVSPSLPPGLALDSVHGTISGTPTVPAAAAQYTITARNGGGTATTSIQITVVAIAPEFQYSRLFNTLILGQPASIKARSIGGPVTAWSIAPALPEGLALDAATGEISGTPASTSLSAAYTVTAQNSGGSYSLKLVLQVPSNVLLDLVHAGNMHMIQVSGTRMLSASGEIVISQEGAPGSAFLSIVDRCNLFDTQSDVLLAHYECGSNAALAGPTAVLPGPKGSSLGLQVIAAADGRLLAQIDAPYAWWKLASDGSYLILGSTSGLTFYSPAGQVLGQRSGDYSAAAVFAAPGKALIALGPQGASRIESVTTAGSSSLSQSFPGIFNEWFDDGSHFQTVDVNAGVVTTYMPDATQIDVKQGAQIAQLLEFGTVGGRGTWFWIASRVGSALYAVGSSQQPAYSTGGSTIIFDLVSAVGIVSNPSDPQQQVTIVDLSGSTPSSHLLSVPKGDSLILGGVSATQWYGGTLEGVLFDGAKLGTAGQYLSTGEPRTVGGRGSFVAMSTESQQILVLDSTRGTILSTISLSAGDVQLSADGSVLAAASGFLYDTTLTDQSTSIFSLPAGTLQYRWPYSSTATPNAPGFTLAPSGTLLGQTFTTNIGTSYARQVTAPTGGAVLWSDTAPDYESPVLFSPDATLFAVTRYPPASSEQADALTDIYRNLSATPVATIPGIAVGWVSSAQLLVNSFAKTDPTTKIAKYLGATLYSPTGTVIAHPALPNLNALFDFVPIDDSHLYSRYYNMVFGLPGGQPVLGTGLSPDYDYNSFTGTATPGAVIYPSGSQLLRFTY